MRNLFGVTVFHRSIANWSLGGVDASSIYVYSAIWETYLVDQYFIDLLSIGVGMNVSSLYVFSAICDTYLVYWYLIDVLSIGMGVYVSLVDVHSAICVT